MVEWLPGWKRMVLEPILELAVQLEKPMEALQLIRVSTRRISTKAR